FHVGEYGYVFSMLPGICVIAARGAIALARGTRLPQTLPWLVAAVALANGSIFLLSDTPLSATDVIRKDRGTIEKLEFLQTAIDLRGATIVTAYDALVVIHYSMEHTPGYGDHSVIGYDPANQPIEFNFGSADCAPGVGPLQGCAHSPVLAVWDDLVRVRGDGWQEVRMPHGTRTRRCSRCGMTSCACAATDGRRSVCRTARGCASRATPPARTCASTVSK